MAENKQIADLIDAPTTSLPESDQRIAFMELLGIRFGDIRPTMATGDYKGWIIMNGRARNTLNSRQKQVIDDLGLGRVPDMRGRILQGTESGLALGSENGAKTVTITQENLPNVQFEGETSFAGAHQHDYTRPSDTNVKQGGGSNSKNAQHKNKINTAKTTSNGSHKHDVLVESGGTDTPISIEQRSFVVNYVIYLGE